MTLNDLLLPEVKKVFYGWLQQQGALNEYKEALKEYERCNCTKLGRLIYNRETPILKHAKKYLK